MDRHRCGIVRHFWRKQRRFPTNTEHGPIRSQQHGGRTGRGIVVGRGARVFVSFQSRQDEQAHKLVEFLEAAGHTCWHMNRNIRSGHDWQTEIQRGIEWCTDLVLLFGPESDASKHVKRELNLADSDDKTIHWLRLADVQPDKLRYLLSLTQKVDWFDQDIAPEKLLDELAPQLRRPIVVDEDDEQTDYNPDSTEIVTLFVDRLSERDALRQSLEAHIRETSQEVASSQVNNNLLTFYGVGGQGKSRLSRRLERWIKGALPEGDHWGAPPRTALTVRWDFDQPHDRPQLLSFLAAFRRMLARTGHLFPEFDIAFAAFYIKAAGDISGDAALRSLEDELLRVIDGLAAQLGLTGSVDVLTLSRLRRLLAVDRESATPVFQQPDALGQLLGLIGDRGDSLDSWPLIVADAMDTVTRRLHQLPPGGTVGHRGVRRHVRGHPVPRPAHQRAGHQRPDRAPAAVPVRGDGARATHLARAGLPTRPMGGSAALAEPHPNGAGR